MKLLVSLCMMFSLIGCQSELLKVNRVKYVKSYTHYPTDTYRLENAEKTLAPLVPGYAKQLALKKSEVSILPRPHEDTSYLEIEFLNGKQLTVSLPSHLLSKGNDKELKEYLDEGADERYIQLFKDILEINKLAIDEYE